jgi:hypothetical protein
LEPLTGSIRSAIFNHASAEDDCVRTAFLLTSLNRTKACSTVIGIVANLPHSHDIVHSVTVQGDGAQRARKVDACKFSAKTGWASRRIR